MVNLGDTIGKSVTEIKRINSELSVGDVGDITTLDIHRDEIYLLNTRNKETRQEEGSVFVLGTSYALMGSSGYVLGPNTTTRATTRIYNVSNLFIEGFWNNRFFGSSTGSWYNSSEEQYYVLNGSQYFFSDYIAKEDKVYKSIRLDILSEYSLTGSDANSDLTSYAIIGSDSHYLGANTTTALSNFSSDGIKIKITNTGSNTIKLKEFLVRYSV